MVNLSTGIFETRDGEKISDLIKYNGILWLQRQNFCKKNRRFQ